MKYILLIFILIFTACSSRSYEKTETKIIIIKSPKIKFADLGYVRNSDEKIELELFIAGKCIETITVNHLICVSEGCMSKSGFNEDYLNEAYPDDTLQNILLARPIYDGKDLQKTADGFEQHVQNQHVDISYRVDSHVTFFKDRKNNIIFKIKDTSGQ
ncbi:MAG: hypothetical protein KAR81_05510 [Sulfurimonas sp.]|nr:hypothetical protein [Sulfurimonas sp.]